MNPRFLLLSACVALLFSGCSGVFKGKEIASKGVTEFHQLFNDGKLEQIYTSADPQFQKAATKQDFFNLMQAVQRKLGKVTGAAEAGYNVRTFNFTTTVILNENTTFEQGKGTETFTYQVHGEEAKLVGYNIASNDLITK